MADARLLQDKVYRQLKDKINGGELSHGQIYSETKLASELGVSRTPMKDALRRLSQERFIDIIPSKGFKLHEMTEDDIWNTYQTRMAIEGFCALHLAQNKNTLEGKKALKNMKRSIRDMQESIENGETRENVLEDDMRFHEILVHFSQNRELIDLYESYNHRLNAIAMESFEKENRQSDALTEHEAIYNAIVDASEDPDMNAYQAVRSHMEASRDIALNLL